MGLKLHPIDKRKFNKKMRNLQLAPIALTGAVKLAAQKAAADARQKAPEDTGRLKSGITSKNKTTGAEIVSEAPYSRHVEYGTRHKGAQPFFGPAVRKLKVRLKDAFINILRKT